MTSRLCPVEGCSHLVHDPKYLMCRAHWGRVPPALQKTVWMLWNNGKIRDGYREAAANAIEQAAVRTLF